MRVAPRTTGASSPPCLAGFFVQFLQPLACFAAYVSGRGSAITGTAAHRALHSEHTEHILRYPPIERLHDLQAEAVQRHPGFDGRGDNAPARVMGLAERHALSPPQPIGEIGSSGVTLPCRL